MYRSRERPGSRLFFTKGSYHRFVMVRFDARALLQQRLEALPAKARPAPVGTGTITLNLDQLLRLLTKSPLLAFDKPQVSREYVVSLPAAPGGQASTRVYTGFDPGAHEATLMEVRWFEREGVVYFFFCTTADPDGEEARQEKQKYFSTIQLSRP